MKMLTILNAGLKTDYYGYFMVTIMFLFSIVPSHLTLRASTIFL